MIRIYSIFLFSLVLFSCNQEEQVLSRTSDFNFDWKFSLEEHEDAWKSDFNDDNWRALNLPHDWVVENSMDPNFEFWQATGRIPGKGIGWYRKKFINQATEDEVTYILFDGMYNNATIWINGKQLGFHPYGYSPFYYDLTQYLNRNAQENVIVVKIDHTRYADSRWYTGAGIYRNVKLITTNKLHVSVWGMFITTPEVSSETAKVKARIKIENHFQEAKNVILNTSLFGPDGKRVAQQKEEILIEKESEITQVFNIQNPSLWDIENPHLYKAISTILIDGKEVDSYEQTFGIRSIRFDANKGFFLNNKNTKIKGVCLHHDGGLVGTAVPKGVWKRRLKTLKEAGCNAIRSAHNPASDEFLDLCDEMGFLVQDEFFDEWDNPKDKRFNMNQKSVHEETQGYGQYFQKWAEQDLKTTMLSHRNHPSIIQWSIGNEIEWTYPRNQAATGFFNNMNWSGNYFWSEPPFAPAKIKEMLTTLPKEEYDIGLTAQKLAKWTKQYDTTRYVTANCILPSVSHLNGYVDALDMVGYSYRRVLYDYGHKNYPEVPIMGMENVPQFHEWKAIMEKDHIAGTYLWTGVDYMGEVRAAYPAKTNGSGILDLAGFTKPAYHMYKTLWSDESHIFMTTNIYDQIKYNGKRLYKINSGLEVEEYTSDAWKHFVWGWQSVNEHWNYNLNDTVIVEVFTNCAQAELYLNDQSLGVKNKADFEDNILKWAVLFKPGELSVKGIHEGKKQVSFKYATAGDATAIHTTIDKKELIADHYDVAHIVVQLLDEKGNPTHDNRLIEFEVNDGLRILGVDNGSSNNSQDFQAQQIETHKGRALLMLQSKDKIGEAVIKVKSKGMLDQQILIDIRSSK